MVKSFSTEVADLEPVMALLCRKQVRVGDTGCTFLLCSVHAAWLSGSTFISWPSVCASM